MTISGGIKFFNQNSADSLTGAEVTSATSGEPSADFILDKNKYTVWRSVGSDDLTIEALTITLASSESFSRLFLISHNFLEYTVKYWNGAAFVDFANVVGVNSIGTSGINETSYSRGSSYYEFSSVTTDKIQITATKTQVVDEEKFLNSFVITTELGTLQGFPNIKNATKDKNIRKSTLLNGRQFVVKSLEVMRFFIDFKDYPPDLADDLDLLLTLFERDDSFYTWLCGGRSGDPYFKYQLSGFRLQDLIQTQVTNVFKDSYSKNIYNSMTNMKLTLEESA